MTDKLCSARWCNDITDTLMAGKTRLRFLPDASTVASLSPTYMRSLVESVKTHMSGEKSLFDRVSKPCGDMVQ